MQETPQHGIIDVKLDLPPRRLLRVPHRTGDLLVGYPAFGPNYFGSNIQEIRKQYAHPATGQIILFRELTTAESLSVVAYHFEKLAKPQIFDPRWLQMGWIIRTSQGVFANPPKDAQGEVIMDDLELTARLQNATRISVGGGYIQLDEDDFGFADYSSFVRNLQDCDTFAQGGLARILEHAESNVAEKLRAIASPMLYMEGVNVHNFEPVSDPVKKIVGLGSGRYFGDRLGVGGDYDWDNYGGYAFGGLDSREAGAPKNA